MIPEGEAKKLLEYKDTLGIRGYDSKGNKKRGRPRGSKKTRAGGSQHKPKYCRLGVVIKNNPDIVQHIKDKRIKNIIIDGYSCILVLKDSTIIRL